MNHEPPSEPYMWPASWRQIVTCLECHGSWGLVIEERFVCAFAPSDSGGLRVEQRAHMQKGTTKALRKLEIRNLRVFGLLASATIAATK